jgi:hypothetical protein
MASTFKRVNKHMNFGDEAFHVIPESRPMAAQYLQVYEFSLPQGQSLGDMISLDRAHSRVTAMTADASSRDLRILAARAEAWLADNELQGTVTGDAVLRAWLSKINIEAMIGGTLTSLAFISLLMVVVFRSLKFGAISLAPNLLPMGIAIGIWAYLVGSAGIAIATIGTTTLGIIVDDTIHMLWRYRAARRAGLEAGPAARHMIATAGEAVIVTSGVLIIGFAVLAMSGFHINHALGAMAAITIACALVLDLFLLPPILMTFDGKRLRAEGVEKDGPPNASPA